MRNVIHFVDLMSRQVGSHQPQPGPPRVSGPAPPGKRIRAAWCWAGAASSSSSHIFPSTLWSSHGPSPFLSLSPNVPEAGPFNTQGALGRPWLGPLHPGRHSQVLSRAGGEHACHWPKSELGTFCTAGDPVAANGVRRRGGGTRGHRLPGSPMRTRPCPTQREAGGPRVPTTLSQRDNTTRFWGGNPSPWGLSKGH